MANDPLRIINASAPTRICDVGGWTDTWFARHGRALNVAIWPRAEVEVRVLPREGRPRVVLHAEDWDADFRVPEVEDNYGDDPIVLGAIDFMNVPDDVALEVTVYSRMPDGPATGTSSAIIVALVAALDRLTPHRLAPHEMARTAHQVESELLGQQAGIQDAVAAACGGVQYIEVHRYPQWTASRMLIDQETAWELERRLVLVYTGGPHSSDEMHAAVIRELSTGGEHHPAIERLRTLAVEARDAVTRGDLDTFGRVLRDTNDAQAELHEAIVSDRHRQIIEIAKKHGALGWKVNGAGGRGGTVAILMPPRAHIRHQLENALCEADDAFQIIPLRLDNDGVRAWESPPMERATT